MWAAPRSGAFRVFAVLKFRKSPYKPPYMERSASAPRSGAFRVFAVLEFRKSPGIAGILCAHFLKERGIKYILAEKDTICSHTTGNTTAKITAQHGLIYQKLIKTAGEERARQYLEANQLAVRKYFISGNCQIPQKTFYKGMFI